LVSDKICSIAVLEFVTGSWVVSKTSNFYCTYIGLCCTIALGSSQQSVVAVRRWQVWCIALVSDKGVCIR
jgi:hypothetical protein